MDGPPRNNGPEVQNMCDCCGNRDPRSAPTMIVLKPKKAEPEEQKAEEKRD
jgi:hypothetical protein